MNAFSRIKLLIQLNNQIGKLQTALVQFQKENQMLSLGEVAKSKTVWLNVITAAMAGYNAISGNLPTEVTNIVAAAGPILTIIFKIFFNQQAK